MSTSLQIDQPAKTAKRTLTLSVDDWEMFDEYVTAAKSAQAGIDETMVLSAILQKQISKDRVFQQWRREHVAATPQKEA